MVSSAGSTLKLTPVPQTTAPGLARCITDPTVRSWASRAAAAPVNPQRDSMACTIIGPNMSPKLLTGRRSRITRPRRPE
jgi:hypothetical protein